MISRSRQRGFLLNPFRFGGGGGGGSSLLWNSADAGPNVTLSNGALDASSHTADSVRGTIGQSTGIWQFETTVIVWNAQMVGVGNSSASLTSYPGVDANGVGYYHDGRSFYNGTNNGYGASYTSPGSVVGCVVDFTGGTITFYRDGASQGSVGYFPTGTLYPMFGDGGVTAGAGQPVQRINTTLTYPVGGASQW